MKVLQINSVCGVGSTGRIATDLHSILKEQGHESYIAYGRGEPKNCDNAIKIGSKLDNYLHVVQTRLFDRHGFGSYYATKKFIKQIEKLEPDIIHLHNIHGYYINIRVLFEYLKTINKPIVWTLHDCWAFTGHCAHFDYIGCEKWRNGCMQCPQKKEYPTSIGIDNSEKNYRIKEQIFTGVKNMTIITPSYWLAGLVKKSFLKDYEVKVINNGIDLNVFKPTKSDFRNKHNIEDKFLVLGVANVWEQKKGLDYILKLSSELDKEKQIVLVGVTDKQKSQLPKNIIAITRTNNTKELAQIYTQADVFLNPTLEDTFPTTNLEALACGTPVVTFRTGGSIESLNDSCGIIVEKGNFEDIKGAIAKLQGLDVRNECIAKSKQYSKMERFMEYIDVYQKKEEKE